MQADGRFMSLRTGHPKPGVPLASLSWLAAQNSKQLLGNPAGKEHIMTTALLTDIVETAVAAGSFKTLATALTKAGLVETLKGNGPFTVFAPTDAAFAKLPAGTLENLLKPENKAKLTAILTYHVVSGKVMTKDAMGLSSAKTVNGQELRIVTRDGKVMVDNATVTKADIDCANGVIHVIDAVILPK